MRVSKVQRELEVELMDDEILLWRGHSRKGIIFRFNDFFYIPLSLIWLGISLFFLIEAYHSSRWSFFTFYLIVFVIAGLQLAIGRFFYDSYRRANTLYGITDRRVIIESCILLQDCKSIYVEDISDISVIEKADGSGTIIFGLNDLKFSNLPGLGKYNRRKPPTRLELINDVQSVYSLIIKIQGH